MSPLHSCRLAVVKIQSAFIRTPWKSRGGVIVRNLPVQEFMKAGVAHLEASSEFRSIFENYPQDLFPAQTEEKAQRDYLSQLRLDLAPILARDVSLALQREFPQLLLSHFGLGFTSGGTPSDRFYWHYDLIRPENIPQARDAFLRGELNQFRVRYTFPFLWNSVAPTVVRPLAGEFKGQNVQGQPGTLTVFVTEVIEHSAPRSPRRPYMRQLFVGQHNAEIRAVAR